jgi:hypothetical protein
MQKEYTIVWQSPDEREGRREDTWGFYTVVLKSYECKEKLNVPALHLLRKILIGPT